MRFSLLAFPLLMTMSGCQCGGPTQAVESLDASTEVEADGGEDGGAPFDAGENTGADAGEDAGLAADGGGSADGGSDGGPLWDGGCGPPSIRWVTGSAHQSQASTGSEIHAWAMDAQKEHAYVGGQLQGRVTLGVGTPQQVQLVGSQIGSPVLLQYAPDGGLGWGKTLQTPWGWILSVRVHPDDSLVVAGSYSTSLKADVGLPSERHITTASNDTNLFLARYDSNHQLEWLRNAGGPYTDQANAIAPAADGGYYLTGYFHQQAVFGLGEPNETTLSAAGGAFEDIFLARYEQDGTLRWVRGAGGTGRDDLAWHLIPLTDGVLVSGSYDDQAHFSGGGNAVTLSVATSAPGVFLARYSDQGALLWARGTSRYATGGAMALLPDSSIVMVGDADPATVIGTGAPQPIPFAAGGAFIARFNQQGEVLSVSSLGSAGVTPRKVLADGHGRIFVTGDIYAEVSFPTAPPTRHPNAFNWTNAFLTCGSPSQPVQWVHFAEGILQDDGRGFGLLGNDLAWTGYARDGKAALHTTSPPTPLPGTMYLLRLAVP